MTDFEKVKALLDELGIGYTAGECERYTRDKTAWEDCLHITLEEGQEKVEGYCGFYTRFEFLPDGTFDLVGAWE